MKSGDRSIHALGGRRNAISLQRARCQAIAKPVWTAALFCLTGVAPLHANGPSSRCYYSDGDTFFSVDDITLEVSKLPDIQRDADGKPIALRLVVLPADASVEDTKLGIYSGQEIHRLVYTQPDPDGHFRIAEGESGKLLCVLVGLATGHKGDDTVEIRPFYFTNNTEEIGRFDSFFTSTSARPFALLLQESLLGTARPESNYTFVFAPGGAQLVERTDSAKERPLGRIKSTTLYHYSKTGKVTTTKREDKE